MSAMSQEQAKALVQSDSFDARWYREYYKDVAMLDMEAAEHFVWIGHRLGRAPNAEALRRKEGVDLRWCVMTTPHVLFLAHILAEAIRRHGWAVDIVTEAPAGFPHDYYIVLCPQMFEILPPGEKRILYQLEQSTSSRWFTPKYFSDMENSFAVFDYSLDNIAYLEKRGVAYPLVYYMPIGASPAYAPAQPVAKQYDILFYGDYKSCPRRQKLIALVREKYDIKLVDSAFGDEVREMIAASRLVLNIHYYENAQLETPRLQECLSVGVPVVSEGTRDQGDYPDLADAITFFEEGSGEAMMAAVERVLADPVARMRHVDAAVRAGQHRWNFMFDRFLIGAGIVKASALDAVAPEACPENALFALSLPETIGRRRIFDAETRRDGCIVFDGIRRRPGWIGCGMSYKHLAVSALKAGVERITVMEDDVVFGPEHDRMMAVVEDYLARREGQWDIFSGVIANLHEEARVLNVETYRGLEFVTIDKMTSTVFNIYSRRALEYIAAWNPMFEDAQVNTIDRYLEHAGLRIVLTDPFMVGHREEMHSTLWGFQNTQYRDMIAESQRQLGRIKRAWLDAGVRA